ncbi:MAG: tyrosine-protein phosphatase [Treponema sp.]|nr:tyrosine-protein phosphatase [Treponema sp.]
MEIIKLDHAKNYRDLGGLTTTDGRHLKNCMLIRGTTLNKLSKKDINLLREKYKLATIVDLRTKKEAIEKPDASLPDVEYLHCPVLSESVVGLSHERRVNSFKSLEMMPSMEDLYISMVTDVSLTNMISVLKKILTMPPERFSLVFHCSAGKDRTGILAALLLLFLGVDRKTVVEDYLFTNKVTKIKAKFVYVSLLVVRMSHKIAHKIKNYFLAQEDYIESALKTLEQRYGSLDNFFKVSLRFSPEEIEEIRNKFLN